MYSFIVRHRILLLSLFVIVLVVAPIAYFVLTSIGQSGKTKVTIYSVPEDARITLNDQVFKPGVSYIAPGNYALKANRDGFTSYESIEVVEKSEKVIIVGLDPVSDEAKKWAAANDDKYLQLEGKAGDAARKEGEAFREKNPIVNSLPFSNLLYTIGYRNDPDDPSGNSIILTIDTIDGYRNAAIQKIRELGYDPAQFKIEFKNYESPFENE